MDLRFWEIISNLCQFISIPLFYLAIMQPKEIFLREKYGKVLCAILLFLPVSMKLFFLYTPNTSTMLFIMISVFVVLGLITQGTWKEKILLFVTLWACSLWIEVFIIMLWPAGIMEINSSVFRAYRMLSAIIVLPVVTVWGLLIRKLREKWESPIMNKFYIYILGQFLIQYTMYSAMLNRRKMTIGTEVVLNIEKETVWFYRLGIFVFLIITMAAYFLLFFYMNWEQKKIQFQMKEKEMEENIRYYRQMEKEALHIQKIRHDAGNHLRMAEHMIKTDPGKAKEYLAELRKSIEEF